MSLPEQLTTFRPRAHTESSSTDPKIPLQPVPEQSDSNHSNNDDFFISRESSNQMAAIAPSYIPDNRWHFPAKKSSDSYPPTAHRNTDTHPPTDIPPRPPNPTLSELEEVNKPFISKDWYKQRKFWCKHLHLTPILHTFYAHVVNPVAITFVLIVAATAITFAVLHEKIAKELAPVGKWLREHPYGWNIPVAIMVILSFPPLFGHEIVALLVGGLYGKLGIGFAIVAAGTILGEVLNFL